MIVMAGYGVPRSYRHMVGTFLSYTSGFGMLQDVFLNVRTRYGHFDEQHHYFLLIKYASYFYYRLDQDTLKANFTQGWLGSAHLPSRNERGRYSVSQMALEIITRKGELLMGRSSGYRWQKL